MKQFIIYKVIKLNQNIEDMVSSLDKYTHQVDGLIA